MEGKWETRYNKPAKLMHSVLLSAFSVEFRDILSQWTVGNAHETITLALTEYTFMCFVFRYVRTAFVVVPHQILTEPHKGFRKFSISAVHSFYGSKRTSNPKPFLVEDKQRPVVYLTQSRTTWPCISKSSTRDKWSDPKVTPPLWGC